ncbi:hypothetical protein, partial [Serratia marcescens]|uniref:hypothetical protein n=1 Tax=Serratia marcescens TaxID=615 RepID=UPI00158D6D81
MARHARPHSDDSDCKMLGTRLRSEKVNFSVSRSKGLLSFIDSPHNAVFDVIQRRDRPLIERFLIQEDDDPGLQAAADFEIFALIAELRVADGGQHLLGGVTCHFISAAVFRHFLRGGGERRDGFYFSRKLSEFIRREGL